MHIVAAAALFLLLLSSPAFSASQTAEKCTCTENTFDNRWNGAEAVFAGTVQKVEIVEKHVQYGNKDVPIEVSLYVDEAYKGAKTGGKFTLHTSLTHETCTGHPFRRGERYLIFAYLRREDTYELWSLYNFPSGTYDVGGLCGGTKEASDLGARADMKEIEKRTAPKKEKDGGFMKGIFND